MSYTTPPTKATGENVTVANWNTHLKANLDALNDGTGIADGAIVTARIADDAVTAAKIAAGAVGSSEIADGAVTEAEIATDAVTEAKIGTGAVTRGKIGNGEVHTEKLADESVTAAKVADNTNENITLASLWSNTGGGAHAASAQKDVTGRVYLRGLVTRGASAGTTIGTIPVGYRPWAEEVFPAGLKVGASGSVAVRITTGGDIITVAALSTGDEVSLSGITYHTVV